MSNGFKQLAIASLMIFGTASYYSQNVLPASGNVGIGTATPSTELQVEGTSTLSKAIIRDTATFEKPVIIKDSVRIDKKLTVDQDLRIKGKTVVDDNLRAKSNITVLGTTRMMGDGFVEGNFRFKNLADSTLSDERFLMLKPNGKVESMDKGGLQEIMYLPSSCIALPNGNNPAPVWSHIIGLNGAPGVIYTGTNCPGNVGIGTDNPLGKLDVRGNVFIGGGQSANGSMLSINQSAPNKNGLDVFLTSSSPNLSGIGINTVLNQLDRKAINVSNSALNTDVFSVFGDGHTQIKMEERTSKALSVLDLNNNIVFVVKGNGRVGVGTDKTPYNLSVDGSIGARLVKVELDIWADYVFEECYNLLSIEELEKYVVENKHLPNVPSETEVLENGVDLGKMDAVLLEKIEELTLYIIQLKKENKEIKEQLNTISK